MVSWEKEAVQSGSQLARVFSPSNIALAKYWGKRDVGLNLPTNGSVSITLKSYGSFTTVEFNEAFDRDRLILDGVEEVTVGKTDKVRRVLDEVRALTGVTARARVQSRNNFPTAAGLASSASGLSAVTYGAARALSVDSSETKLSEIARKGSGSACRSLYGGFVEWVRGERADGTDSVAHQLAPSSHWPLKALIAVVNRAQKNHASTGGMEHTRLTSPYFAPWVESAQKQAAEIKAAIKARDFTKLAELAESNCIRMHTSAMASFPPVFYWQGATLDLMQKVWGLRRDGVPAFFTIDAGPNVVVVCEPQAVSRVREQLLETPGISVLSTDIGAGSRAYDQAEWNGEI